MSLRLHPSCHDRVRIRIGDGDIFPGHFLGNRNTAFSIGPIVIEVYCNFCRPLQCDFLQIAVHGQRQQPIFCPHFIHLLKYRRSIGVQADSFDGNRNGCIRNCSKCPAWYGQQQAEHQKQTHNSIFPCFFHFHIPLQVSFFYYILLRFRRNVNRTFFVCINEWCHFFLLSIDKIHFLEYIKCVKIRGHANSLSPTHNIIIHPFAPGLLYYGSSKRAVLR